MNHDDKSTPAQADIIAFPRPRAPSPDYGEAVDNAIGELDACVGRMTASALTFASAGVWKSWSQAVPAGTVMQFSSEELMNADDPVVKKLAELLHEMEATLGALQDDEPGAFVEFSLPASSTRVAPSKGLGTLFEFLWGTPQSSTPSIPAPLPCQPPRFQLRDPLAPANPIIGA